MAIFSYKVNDLVKVLVVTDDVTKKASLKTNIFSKIDEELFFNILQDCALLWDFS